MPKASACERSEARRIGKVENFKSFRKSTAVPPWSYFPKPTLEALLTVPSVSNGLNEL